MKSRRYQRWTEEEIKLLKKYCQAYGVRYASKKLGRSVNAINAIAHLHKIKCKKATPVWNPKNIAFLKKWYGKIDTAVIAKKIGTTKLAVQKQASRLRITGIKR